ncbi:MAG: hypothetical protein ACK4NC_05825 [Candidatus Gracilibacteria bacterium]
METARSYVDGYVGKKIERLSSEKEEVAKKLASLGLEHFHNAVEKIVDDQVTEETKRLEKNQRGLEEHLQKNGINRKLEDTGVFEGSNTDDGMRVVGTHNHATEETAIDQREMEMAVESGDYTRVNHILAHEETHENYPGPDIYQQDPEILQKTLIGLYEGWTEDKNRENLGTAVLEAYEKERALLKETVERAGNKEHLEKALKEKDSFGARIILLHSLQHTRPDLLGGYDPTFEFMLYKSKKNI